MAETPTSDPEQRRDPSQIAQFEIVRRLGAGGMAEVFLARKRGAEGTYKVVVVKRILPAFTTSRRFRSMFIDEAQLATRLNHPNVVQVYEFSNEGDEGHILAMEYVEGCDLGQLMSAVKSRGRLLDPWTAAFIVAEAAKGLHYAHEKRDEGGAPLDIVHRDVSPQNVLLSFEGVVKIADFGIASARLTDEEEGVLKGKFGYMSPEQARGEKVDRRGDLYALGVIFWECLAGRPLHGGLGGEALLDIVRSGRVEPPSTYVRDLPEELESIVLKLLAARPEDRYPTGRDVAAVIGRAMLQRQMLADGTELERALATFVPREGPSLTFHQHDSHAPPEHHTQAAAPHALSGAEGAPRSMSNSQPPLAGRKSSPPGAAASRRPEAREVRHVALVTLRLVPPPAPADGEPPVSTVEQRRALVRALERSRGMFGDMAYKRGMRWVWTGDFEARAIAGLGPKPAKAAADAAWLAVETHEAIHAIEEDLPVPVAASVSIVRGIASGTRDPEGNLVRYVLHDPVTYLADVVARATPPHETWVAGGVFRLVRRDFKWGDAPTLDLKADLATADRVQHLPPTMRIYTLRRSLSRDEKAAEQESAQSDLVGRDAEKADLHAAYHAALNGPGGGLVSCRAIVGELGIGKTALVSTFSGELPMAARLVRCECTPVRMEVPYSALAELVRDAIGASGEESYDEIAHLIARAGGGSAQADTTNPMVARLAEIAANQQAGANVALPSAEDEDAHYRRKVLVSGVRYLVAAIALDQPLVLVIDGLQWADKPTLDLLGDVLRTPDALPVLLLLVTRPDERVASLLEGKVRIELQALSSEEQIRLVETRLAVREGARPVCEELMPRVGGNPFYLLEMIDALLERGILEIRDDVLTRPHGGDLDAMGLPSTLEQLLADRIQELPGPEHVVVDWLAIAGGPLGLADLTKLNTRAAQQRGAPPAPSEADVAKSALRTTEDAVVRLCARGLCDRKGDVLDFRHPLTRDVAYAALDPMTRSRMHSALGEHLADNTSLARGVEAAIVARHLVKGDAPSRAAQFYLEAASAARAAYQTQLAIRYYLRAAQHFPADARQLLLVHEALEGTFRVLGRKRERVRHLELLRRTARSIGTARAACLALLRTGRYDLDEGHLSHGLPVARKAAAIAHSANIAAYEIDAELLVSELARELGDVQGALAACDRALAACNPRVNPSVPARARADVLRSRGVLLRRVGRVREAVDAYVEAIGVFRRAGARRQEARAKNALAYAMFVQGRYEDAIALALESIRIDLSIGGRFQLAKTLSNIGQCYARLGDMARAQAYLKRAREAHERYGDQDGRADTLLVSAGVVLELGDVEAAGAYVREAMSIVAVTGNTYDQTHAEVLAAAVARYRRDASLALQYAGQARRSAEQQALVSFHFYAFAIEAAARVDAGEVHAATLLATTALGAVEALQGCEYGLEIRVLCADALKRAASPQAPAARQKAVDYAAALMIAIRDSRLKRCFSERPLVTTLFDSTPMPHAAASENDRR
ncbi:MAG: Serine/threonine protein kinase [Labilithrix sp.]|nr:Serine/threonine protein kinase [Labilithrix sp.]